MVAPPFAIDREDLEDELFQQLLCEVVSGRAQVPSVGDVIRKVRGRGEKIGTTTAEGLDKQEPNLTSIPPLASSCPS